MLKVEIKRALMECGLKPGDLVLVHADVTSVIKLLGDENWDNALELIKTAFMEVLGDAGTLIVPAFNWDFCKGIPYDEKKTPSKQGLFANYILRHPEALRSPHPMFSFAGFGAQIKPLFYGIGKSSFGYNSVFDRLKHRNARLVFFNTSFYNCTFVHYVEHVLAVPYRYTKYFSGQVTIDDETYTDTFEFYVRDEKQIVTSYPTRLGERLLEKGLMTAAPLGQGSVMSATCHDVYEEALSSLSEDPFFLLKHPPVALDDYDS